MIALAGLPLVLALGALADLLGERIERALGQKASKPSKTSPADLWRALRARTPGRDRPGALQVAGALVAMAGGGLAGAALIGAVPGALATLGLAMVAASLGAHLALSDPSTRPRARAAAGDRVAAIPFEVLFVLGVVAAFARWRAADLESIRGAQAVLGPGFLVGPASRLAALILGAAVIAIAGGARVAPPGVAAPGRGLRPEGAALVALARWSALGSVALLWAALVAGPAIGEGGSWSSAGRALPTWAAGLAAGAAACGLASRRLGGGSHGPRRRAFVGGILLLAVVGSALLGLR